MKHGNEAAQMGALCDKIYAETAPTTRLPVYTSGGVLTDINGNAVNRSRAGAQRLADKFARQSTRECHGLEWRGAVAPGPFTSIVNGEPAQYWRVTVGR